jgi:hypothetical protein
MEVEASAAGAGRTWRRRAATVLAALALAGCASTPESRERQAIWDELYYTPARACNARITSFGVERVELDGTVDLVGHISLGIDEFRACYWKAVTTGIERRRAAGKPVPGWVNPHPDVEIDQD